MNTLGLTASAVLGVMRFFDPLRMRLLQDGAVKGMLRGGTRSGGLARGIEFLRELLDVKAKQDLLLVSQLA